MKFVFISPPSYTPTVLSPLTRQSKSPPLAGLYLGAVVKDLCEFHIIDGFGNFFSSDNIVEKITSLAPDYVGISINFSSLLESALDLARKTKKQYPNIKIVLGGNVATYMSGDLIKNEYVDFIFLNEAEVSFRQFVEKIVANSTDFQSISGLVYKNSSNKIIRNEFKSYIKNLDHLPFPDYSLLDDRENYIPIISSSRGCPYDCFYCSTKQMWGTSWRKRSAESIIDEIIYAQQVTRSSMVNFSDDNFLVDRKRFEKIVSIAKSKKLKIKTGYSARIELIDEEIILLSKNLGVSEVFFGVESGSEKVLKTLNRQYSPEKVVQTIELCRKHGIVPTASFMIGLPHETMADARKTFALIKRINTPNIQMHICTPLIGTDMYINPAQYGISVEMDKVKRGDIDSIPTMSTEYLNQVDIMELYLEGMGLIAEKNRLYSPMKKRVD